MTAVLVVLLAVSAAWLVWRQRRQPPVRSRWRSTVAVRVAAVAAVGCTAYSADTGWRFAADYLKMASTVERAFMFAIAELALFATALMARQNLNGPRQAPGLPGVLVWVVTTGQLIPAYAVFGPVGGTVRALIGPVMAAMLWHLAMGIELRHRTPDAASRSLAAVLLRQARERLLARLGIADQDADAARLIRERALSEAVALILLAETMPGKKRGKRRARRLADRLHQALERADVDGNPRQDELLLRKLATRQQALGLASLTLPPRWHIPASSTPRNAEHNPRDADAPRQGRGTDRPNPGGAGTEGADRAAHPQAAPRDEDLARPHPSVPDAGATPSATADSPAPETKAASVAAPPIKEKPEKGGRKTTVPDAVLWATARAIGAELGTVPRTQLEDAVRAKEYTIQKDRAKKVADAVMAELASDSTATAA
ncbi:hypothetical protein OG432_15910 [Streptomyces sp. NBC_00442]|uniref:hypothetical protein n=1 Tax=Streptomyces sp. NBC_00442 TaxID=2903651 RepID=UPI002E1F99BD